jgi:hypothetical protein
VNRTMDERLARSCRSATGQGVVLTYANEFPRRNSRHESATHASVAHRLATLKGYQFAGAYDAARCRGRPLYLVPVDTLVGIEAAQQLGVARETDLFGGVVPYPFVATKTITHPLVHSSAAAPEGWSYDFARRVQDGVLFGFAAFTVDDARLACARVLERGRARFKPACAVGGKGQKVISSAAELDRVLDALDPTALSMYGVSLEENLQDVTTYSIGQVRVDELLATYCGTQRVTSNHCGASVYGGSDLLVVRGDFASLLGLGLAPELRLAVEQARSYDNAALQEFPGFFASRRNYDVAAGCDSRGRRRTGVLEQSWRIGGASPAEVTALEAFRADPSLHAVRASCPEIYDARHEPPPHAHVYFCGEDEELGALIKYSVLEAYGNSR